MFGDESFGVLSFGDGSDVQVDPVAWEAYLAEPVADRCWLVEMDGLVLATVSGESAEFGDAAFGAIAFGDADAGGAGGVQTLRFSSHGYTTLAADAPASTHYDSRVQSSISIDRRIAGRGGIGGLARASAEVRLNNADGGLDNLKRDYALDGRRVRIKLGRMTDALAAFGTVFSGVLSRLEIGRHAARLTLSDGVGKLEVPVNETTYAGTGGTEGGDDLKGRPKPRGWGHVYNIAPPLVDSTNLIYQVNHGAISDVPAVYDRGVLLTKVGGVPVAGQYSVNTAAGTFTLGATPAGTVTCDALLDASGAGYVNRTGDIVLRLLGIVGLTSDEIDPASFVNLTTLAPAEVGIPTGAESRKVAQLADELLAGIGAFGGFNRQGAFSVGLVSAPVGTPVATFDEADILDLAIEPLPADMDPIVWRAAVAWQRNWTVQQDLAASVSAARRTFAAAAERLSVSENVSIRGRHLLAAEYAPGGELYALKADADTEAARRFALWGVERLALRVSLPARALARGLGDLVTIKHSRFGLAAGRDLRVLATRSVGTRVDLWGVA